MAPSSLFLYTPVMVTFLRHGKVLLPYRSHDEMPFEVLADLAIGKLDPGIDRDTTLGLVQKAASFIQAEGGVEIYCSPARRALETAQLIGDVIKERVGTPIDVVPMTALREVRFDLRTLYPGGQEGLDMLSLNSKVLAGVLDGSAEPLASVEERLMEIVAVVQNHPQPLVFVTHDFILRFIEILIKRGGLLGEVTLDDLSLTQRNLYLSGFQTDHSFEAIRYIQSA